MKEEGRVGKEAGGHPGIDQGFTRGKERKQLKKGKDG